MLARARSSVAGTLVCLRSSVHQHHGPAKAVRLSKQYLPTVRPEAIGQEHVDSVALLIRGGYIRQASSGLFTVLPLGLRIIKKLERIVEEEMESVDASRLEMPSLLSSVLWHKSGRFETIGQELFKVKDRRDSEFILAPTCEEEVTKLVGEELKSWRDLPVRVYQITTKFRDEPRPKSGLLRTKSFLMKDLYTFDADIEAATRTYDQVTEAYSRTMNRLFGQQGRGWFAVQADAGAMGGSHSHEYQIPDILGEDEIVTCDSCSYTANSDKARVGARQEALVTDAGDVTVHLFGTRDPLRTQCTLNALILRQGRQVNPLRSAALIGEADAELLYPHSPHQSWDWKDRPEGPLVRFEKIKVILDTECRALDVEEAQAALLGAVEAYGSSPGHLSGVGDRANTDAPQLRDYFPDERAIEGFGVADVRQAEEGDACLECNAGMLRKTKSVEVGHTFILGTRYSSALDYTYTDSDRQQQPLQMGCFGIGISRLLGVLAQCASRRFQALGRPIDKAASGKKGREGLAWSPAVAPYRALILLQKHDDEQQTQAANTIIDALAKGHLHDEVTAALGGDTLSSGNDIALDDRPLRMGEKLNDADLLGSPITFIIGKDLASSGNVELRCIVNDQRTVKQIPVASLVRHHH